MKFYQKEVALGSVAEICLVGHIDEEEATDLFNGLWRQIFLFERRFSRFLPDSELSKFNRSAGFRQTISQEFKAILQAAKAISLETGGLYNPFILPALQAAGYSHSLVKGHEKDYVDDHSEKAVVGAENLEIGDDWASIPHGTALDLGGCGKGYLGDQLARSVGQKLEGYWISLGGDIVAGGVDEGNKSWEISVQDAFAEGSAGMVVFPPGRKSYAVATSGTIARHGHRGGKRWHHLIDPRSLQPAVTDLRLVTVCSDSSFRADVLASCAVILGSDSGLEFLKDNGIKEALLQAESEEGHRSRVQLGKTIKI